MKNILAAMLFALCLMAIASCQKDPEPQPVASTPTPAPTPPPQPDTIFPGSYLPAYPGSYWIYTKSVITSTGTTTGTDTITTSQAYLLHSYVKFTSPSVAPDTSDPAYVPYWNGQPMYEYGTPRTVNTVPSLGSGQEMYYLLSDTVGDISYSSTGNYGDTYTKVAAVDVPVTVGSTTYPLVIITEDYSSFASQTWLWQKHYYAKDVGLIRSIRYSNPSLPPAQRDTVILELNSYFINQ